MPSTSVNLDHDVVLTGSEGTRIGLMLVRPIDTSGRLMSKRWELSEIPVPTGIRVSETGLGTSDLPPEMEASVFRTALSDGMGVQHIVTGSKDYMSGVAHTGSLNKMIHPPRTAEIALPTSAGNVHVWTRFGSALYVSDGRYLHRSTNGTSFTQVMDAGAGFVITDAKAYGAADGDTGLVVAVQNATTEVAVAHWYSTNGTTFAQVTADATRNFHYFVVQNFTLVGLENANTYRTTTDPFVATPTWGGATAVGDENNHFHGGLVISGVLVLLKSDRAYTIDSTGAVSVLIAQFSEDPGHHNFGAYAVGFNSNLCFTVKDEVWEYDPLAGSLRQVGLANLADSQHTVSEDHTMAGAASDGRRLFILHQTNFNADVLTAGTSIAVMTEDNSGAFRFERWLHTSPTNYRPRGPLFFTQTFTALTTGQHLWMNTATAGQVLRMDIPRATDPTLDTTSVYGATAYFRSGWMTHNFPTQVKDYFEVAIDLLGLNVSAPAVTADVYYYINGDWATRYTISTGITTNGLSKLAFPSAASGRSFLLEIITHTNDAAYTAQVLGWSVNASVKFDFREIMQLTFYVVDHTRNRRGNRSRYTAKQIRDRIRSLRETESISIRYQDYRGYDFANVRILPGISEQDSIDDEAGVEESVMTIRLLRVSASGATDLSAWPHPDPLVFWGLNGGYGIGVN